MDKLIKMKDIYINPKNPRYIKDDRFRLLVKNIKEFPKMMESCPIIIDVIIERWENYTLREAVLIK